MRALRVRDALPGAMHEAFCQIPFDSVVTTNVEQLLESAYRSRHGDVLAIIEEQQLRLANPYEAPTLLKLHGDVHHPGSLVLTERDYDEFSLRRPMFVTWLANQLISKTGVLIGYSLDDADFRQIIAMVRSRLGEASPDLYVIEVGADPAKIDRYRRRGVRVVNLPWGPLGYGVLTELFDALYDYWIANFPSRLQGTTAPVRALLRAGVRVDEAVLFLLPDEMVSVYDDFVFPNIADRGLLPLTRQDVAHPPGFRVATTEALLRISSQVVIHTNRVGDPVVRRAIASVGRENVFVVGRSTDDDDEYTMAPPPSVDGWTEVAEVIANWATGVSGQLSFFDEAPLSASRAKDIDLRSSALLEVIEMERALRLTFPEGGIGDGRPDGRRGSRHAGLRQLLELSAERIPVGLPSEDVHFLVETRNKLVHGSGEVLPGDLQRCVDLARVVTRAVRRVGEL